MAQIIIRLPELKAYTGLSRSTLYVLIAQNKFPRQVQLGERAVGWFLSDITKWQQERGSTQT